MHESRESQMRGVKGDAALILDTTRMRTAKPVLAARRILRNEADAVLSARPDSQGSYGTCFGSQGELSIVRRVNPHISILFIKNDI